MGRLEGKKAIVIGATRDGNMGQAIATRFMAEGAEVVVAGRGRAGLDAYVAAHAGPGRTCHAVTCDISSKDSVFALFDEATRLMGRVDIAVNAAATGQYGPFEDTPESELDEMLSIIFKGGFFFMQAAVMAMKKIGGGSIVNLTSQVATIMYSHHSPYMGAKAGLEHVTRCVAHDFGKFNIRANIVAPGFTVTPMTEGTIVPGMVEAFARETPLGRINTVEDIAAATVFAASDECFMTGQTFHCTGGVTLRRLPDPEELATSIAAAAAQ